MYKFLFVIASSLLFGTTLSAQHSVARRWSEVQLQAIREDFARPPVHARNLFHLSIAMYDAWAAYDTVAQPYLLGKTVGSFTCPFNGVETPTDIQAARDQAISYAAFRVLSTRFLNSPNAFLTSTHFYDMMSQLGYDPNFTSTDYASGNPAALGNYIAQNVLQMGLLDGSNEQANYAATQYQAVNPPIVVAQPGNPNLMDPNRWQPLTLTVAIDQNGNPVPATQKFQSPEWGRVVPFALTDADKSVHTRNGYDYWVYHDPGTPPALRTDSVGGASEEFKWNMELVSAWSSHLDPTDGVLWDISPKSNGNNQYYPHNLAELHDFYNFAEGGDNSPGHALNPKTGLPYEPQIVPRGDYTRVLAQFWADGPNSETPPGHWFSIMNKVMDHPDFIRRFNGQGPLLDNLEWDVKSYFTLGGAVHDAAISAWGIKGWYDAPRPLSSLRYMAGLGQSSDPSLPHYHPGGLQLIPGYVELVAEGDSLAGMDNENVGKIKLFTWLGPTAITDIHTDIAGAGWVLAERWVTYQRATFVTPPFAGYISGHSTYSRAAAEALTMLTGDKFFPGGMGEFKISAHDGALIGFEDGPSKDVTLQWATYQDASDQTSLSRIWGGIHPPFDDIPGRLIGMEVGQAAFKHASTYFYKDEDNDGHLSYEDCDDHNASQFPGAQEICDQVDNDCNDAVDDNIALYTYYVDADGDGFGETNANVVTCAAIAPIGFANNNTDCDDANANLAPSVPEACDNVDNNCNGMVDDSLPVFSYYLDVDGDGFGASNTAISTCQAAAPTGYVGDQTDCDDANAYISPSVAEACDNVDNNCNGVVDDNLPVFNYYLDTDGDGFGASSTSALSTCDATAPTGYVSDQTDCDDANAYIAPSVAEACDNVDNNCNGVVDDNLPVFNYYLDMDGDGFGASSTSALSTCDATAPTGYVASQTDCEDANAAINPDAVEVIDAFDNNCNGIIDIDVATKEPIALTKLYPNPVHDVLYISDDLGRICSVKVQNMAGQTVLSTVLDFSTGTVSLDFAAFSPGVYFLRVVDAQSGQEKVAKVVKM